AAFTAAHEKGFGFAMTRRDLVIATATAEARSRAQAPAPMGPRADLAAGAHVDGPAVLTDPLSTTVVEAGWRATARADGGLVLEKAGAAPAPPGTADTTADPMRIELFGNLFMSIAEQMG